MQEISVYDVLVHQYYIDEVIRNIEALIKHRANIETQSGGRLKRGPVESLTERGYLPTDSNNKDWTGMLISEFALILTKQSKVSRTEREFIIATCVPIYHKIYSQLKQEQNELVSKTVGQDLQSQSQPEVDGDTLSPQSEVS